MSEKNLVSRENKDDKLALRQNYAAPAVDIYEQASGLTLVADMPGVSSDKLKIDIVEGVLTLEAVSGINPHGEQLFGEFSPTGYYRQFRLPNHLDLNRVDAQLTDGVLTLKLPKAEAAMPKRIEVKTVH